MPSRIFFFAAIATFFSSNVQVGAAVTPLDSGVVVEEALFSPDEKFLYIAVGDGKVRVFDLASKSFVAPVVVGGEVSAIDISRDGHTLFATQGVQLGVQSGVIGSIDQVDLSTGSITRSTYIGEGLERTPVDVAVAEDRAFFTTGFAGSGWNPLREIDLATSDVSVRTDLVGISSGIGNGVTKDTFLVPSNSDRFVLFSESNISSYPLFLYDSKSDSFVAQTDNRDVPALPRSADGVLDISEEAELIAVQTFDGRIVFLDFNLDFVGEIGPFSALRGDDGGIAFSNDGSLVYSLSPNTDEVIAIATSDFSVAFTQEFSFEIDDSLNRPRVGNRLLVSPLEGLLFIDLGEEFALVQPLLTSAISDVPLPAGWILVATGLICLRAKSRQGANLLNRGS